MTLSRLPSQDDAHLDLPTARNWSVPDVPVVPSPADAPSDLAPTVNRVPALIERAQQKMPSIGEVAFGFTLVRELGRGSYGRVFLATQPELAGRVVALKVSPDLAGESRTLALLQHTNIVPVYSVHRSGALQAVCMPYFGPTTLADVLKAHRARNLLPATGREFVNTLKGLSGPTAGDAAAAGDPAPPRAANAESVFSRLSGLSYVRAVCWLAARLADGLAHAHDRGIMHRDIKPANVLVTGDGQPMLLDFGIAEEMKARVVGGVVGGTLPYMAPEALDEILTGTASADARSDVYSLGVVLFELLTCEYPFRLTAAEGEAAVRRMADERRADPPRLRPVNPAVTPGLESIVRTCLAGDPARRYPSAAALRDDLDRYLADQPLAFAREPSVQERVAKWSRRHPRMTSSATLATAAVGLLVAAGFALAARTDRVNQLEAVQTFKTFQKQSREAHYMLFLRKEEGQQLAAGVEQCRAVLGLYGALDRDDWDRRTTFTALPPDDQNRVRREMADACVLMARAYRHQAATDPTALAEAVRLNERAEAIAGANTPREVFLQRAELMRDAGRHADADAAGRRAADATGDAVREQYAQALTEQMAGKHAAAVAGFRATQALDPKHYWAYFGEGVSHAALGKWADARGCYTAAAALWPTFHWAYFNRGLVLNELKDFAAAEADFTKALDLQPEFPDAYLGRAKARNGRRDFDGALADLDKAAGLGTPPARTDALRAKLRAAAGLPVLGADEPDDEDGWINHGLAKLGKKDAPAAEAAFRRATELSPRSANAVLFLVYAMSEQKKVAECVPLLDRAVELDPENVRARAARAVARARLKQWDAARADAEAALAKSTAASNLYQIAGVYARLSERDPAARGEALALLGVALRGGFGFDHLGTDEDLDPIRKTPEFETLVRDAARFRPAKP